MTSPTQPVSLNDAKLSQALDALWARFLPEISVRLESVDAAVRAVAEGNVTAAQREAAHAAAHKLAGVLGTFSLKRGTELARELERAFAGEASIDADTGAEFAASVAELRALIESRKSFS